MEDARAIVVSGVWSPRFRVLFFLGVSERLSSEDRSGQTTRR